MGMENGFWGYRFVTFESKKAKTKVSGIVRSCYDFCSVKILAIYVHTSHIRNMMP